ncbi:MAG: ChaN family lipoprotein [Vicinamibacterales bacterium]
MTRRRRSFVACCFTLLVSVSVLAQSVYVPQRVFVSARKQFGEFETMLAELSRADVLFFGEQHDDAQTHRIELALLEGLARRRGGIVVALEMFERDVQEPLTQFAGGRITEAAFLEHARAWPQYTRDYKPIVDFAIVQKWPVVAGNVPRTIAADVSRVGLALLKSRPDSEKGWFARDVKCPANDRYFGRFQQTLRGATHGTEREGPLDPETIERYYQAQCLKDETMGESIADAYMAGAVGGKRPLVVSVNGAFHTDFGDGLVERTRRRLPDRKLATVSILPVADLDHVGPDGTERKRADYLIYTTAGK